MKNKYFGDIRDLFKYDLISRICHESVLTERVLFIPMLTENDNRKEGNIIDYKAKAGTQSDKLKNFLNNCRKNDKRDIKEIERFFKSNEVEIHICYDPFINREREKYFDKVKEKSHFFSHSLIFLDPDIGLEIESNKDNKHLLYSEVEELYNKMDSHSILMLYQHFSRESHIEYRCRRS